MKKRGELVTANLISIILVILGFSLLLLMFYFSIDWNKNIDQEVCHESVIFRATAPSIAKTDIPLKCYTIKYCITDKLLEKGDCSEDYGSEKPTTIRVRDIEDIERFYAREILNCWSMMGEGKVDLFSQKLSTDYGLKDVYSSCVICSRIAFDKDLKLDLSEMNIQRYMALHKMPDKDVTYTKYLSDERGLISIDKDLTFSKGEVFDSDVEIKKTETQTLDNHLGITDLKKEDAILFMQISAPETDAFFSVLGDAGIGLGISFVLAPKVTSIIGGNVVKSWWSLAALGIFAFYQANQVAYNRAVTSGYCGDVSSSSEQSRNGCSAVRTTYYNAESISQYCQNIESIS